MPGSCKRGLRSLPSKAAGKRRSNGFDVNSMNNKKPTLITPITPNTLATMSSGKWRLNTLTATDHDASINIHKSNEPSCEPQVAANRYCIGKLELELVATFRTEKSLFINE